MSNKKIKLIDIAEGANVSISTASRYLNGVKVRPRSATRIEEFLAKHKTSRVSVAALQEKNTLPNGCVIGLIIPELNSFFFTSTVSGILDAANEMGYSVITASAQHDPENERRILSRFSEFNLAGLIYTPVAMIRNQLPIEMNAFNNIPIVIANRRDVMPNCIHVYTDNINAGYLATRHLLSRGRTKIGFIIGTWKTPFNSEEIHKLARDYKSLGGFTSVDRFRGYLMALEEYNIPFSSSLLSVTSWDSEGGARGAAELIGKAPDIDGIITTSDLLSATAITTLQKRGYSIPQDISVIGWGNNQLANFTTPTLTSVVNPTYEMGFTAVSVLHRQLNGEQVQNIVFDATIVTRDSTTIKR